MSWTPSPLQQERDRYRRNRTRRTVAITTAVTAVVVAVVVLVVGHSSGWPRTRDNFFEYMPNLLRKEFKPEDITELTPVPGISVPIIKLELCGVSVDLIFCSLHVQSVPKRRTASF